MSGVSDKPWIDHRDAADVLAELLATVPGYSTYWRPRPGGAGYALLQIVARFGAVVVAATGAAVDKGELAFLDAYGIDLLPPQAAQAPMMFQVTPDSPADPGLPSGTQIAAPAPTVLGSIGASTTSAAASALVFSTNTAITLAKARLTTLYSAYPDVDQYADHSAAIASGFLLYDGMQPVDHHLYIGHDTALQLSGDVDLTLEFNLASDLRPDTYTKSGLPKQPKPFPIAWEYLSTDGWATFDSVDDHCYGLAESGQIVLHKRCGSPSAQGAVNGVTSYWLRGRLTAPLSNFGTKQQPKLPLIDTVRMRIANRDGNLPADVAFATDVRLDTTRDFQPFGTQPVVASAFLVSCDAAFRQTDARIGMSLSYTGGTPGQASADLALYWEYSTAPGVWSALGTADAELHDHTANFSAATTLDPVISFLRPPDWAKVNVNGAEEYWLRVRITRGGYGGPTTYTVTDDGGNWSVVPANVPHPPTLSALSFSYETQVGPVIPDHCVTRNGFAYDDESDACRWGGRPFPPFAPMPDLNAAVNFGFDQPLPIGLVSLYVDVPGSGDGSDTPSAYLWEYLAADGWGELSVLDDSSGFTRSGMIELIGPADPVTAPGPSGPTYWIRARTRELIDPEPSAVTSVTLNATWATQRTSVRNEIAGRGDGTPHQIMVAQHAPILRGQTLEVQEWHGTGREWESLFAGIPTDQVRYDTDPRGTVIAVWVTWQERPYLYSSAPTDRHYTIERSTGLLRFGTGAQGMVVPPGASVMLGYDYGGGAPGNVSVGALSQLQSGVPYLAQVTNSEAAAGGAAGETMAEVRRRGPQRLKNGGRPVAPSDYEWLAREASPEVAVARCLPTTGPDGHGEPGWVTVVVVPQGQLPAPQPSQLLLRTVRTALAAAAPAAIASQIRIVGPTYRPVSVVVEAIPTDPGTAAAVEDALVTALNAFLHPVNGGPDRTGWRMGDAVHLSQVVQVVLGTPGVRSAPHVALMSDGDVYGDAVPMGPQTLPIAGRHLVKLTLGVR